LIIQEFLPKAISLDETKRIVMQAIAEFRGQDQEGFGVGDAERYETK